MRYLPLLWIFLAGCSKRADPVLEFSWNARINGGTHSTRFEDRRDNSYKGNIMTVSLKVFPQNEYLFLNTDGSCCDADQQDKNKGEGIKFNWWNSHDETVMVSWHYEPPVNDQYPGWISFQFYSHGAVTFPVGNKRAVDPDHDYFHVESTNGWICQTALRVPLDPINGATVYIEREIHQGRGVVIQRMADNPEMVDFIEETLNFPGDLPERFYLVNPWFGGNREAPHTMRHFFTYKIES